MAGTTRLELATPAVTALREMVLQQHTSTRGLPNAAQVIQDHTIPGVNVEDFDFTFFVLGDLVGYRQRSPVWGKLHSTLRFAALIEAPQQFARTG